MGTCRAAALSMPATPESHFQLYFYAAVSQVLAAAAFDPGGPAPSARPLEAYEAELRHAGVPAMPASAMAGWWQQGIGDWEARTDAFLPIRAVRESTGFDHQAMAMVFAIGLVDEDPRFGALYGQLNHVSGQPRATAGALSACWGATTGVDDVRTRLRALEERGLVRCVASDAPRVGRPFEVSAAVWDALRGERHARPAAGLRYREPSSLLPWSDIIVPPPLREELARLPAILSTGAARTVIVRGPGRNGRRTLLGAIARTIGRGVLDVSDPSRLGEEQGRELALMATALHAMPIACYDPAPGEHVEAPWAVSCDGPVGIALGRGGGIRGAAAEHAVAFSVDVPSSQLRAEHWRRALSSRLAGQPGPAPQPAVVDALAGSFRLTAGNIHASASLASTALRLRGDWPIDVSDVRNATRLLSSQAFEGLATRVSSAGDWRDLAARDETVRDLMDLELRCRYREGLAVAPGTTRPIAAHCGVRALFRGPSGTGKTLAARLLAAVLQKDLYRVDLSSIVNKYIGETEKNLERVISRAEELDIVLLFDEGDALLTQRTEVGSATDRYANLETNFLLQRLESFDGILVVTTNVGERIDPAFERRMDVVVDFQPPQAAERWELWQLHLPESHRVDAEFLNEVATRCALSGGQIRNAVLHASVLAAHARAVIDSALVEIGIRREYRKAGAVCPLRPLGIAAAGA